MLCFYHGVDADGFCSGAIIKNKYPNCEMIGINYNDPFPWDKITDPNEVVFMVDFSLPIDDMKILNEKCKLIWIDHHKTAIDDYSRHLDAGGKVIDGSRVIGQAGCELVWKFLYPLATMPVFVYYIGRYDVWDLKDDVLTFQYGIRQYNTKPYDSNMWFWNRLFDEANAADGSFIREILSTGRILLAFIEKENARVMKTCSYTNFEGLKCLVCNCHYPNSLMFKSVWDNTKYDAMIGFRWIRNNFAISMFTDKYAIDVSAICKKYGGGGHAQAAGFGCKQLPFELLEIETGEK